MKKATYLSCHRPPDPSPVSGFAFGPFPKMIELQLHVNYDSTLLEDDSTLLEGNAEATENFVKSVLHLAEFQTQ